MSRVNAVTSDLPIARLDAQDMEAALLLREYLEGYGVAVVAGRKPAIPATYHIICGDADFVKETAVSATKSDTKPFVVLFLTSREHVPAFLRSIRAKIAVVRGMGLSARDAHALFAYFFTGDQDIFYLERDSRSMVELRPIEEETESLASNRDHVSLKASLFALCVIVAPVVWYLVSLTIIVLVQGYGVGALARGEVTRMGMVTSLTTYWVGQGGGALGIVAPAATMVGAGHMIRSQERVLSVIRDMVTVETKAAELIAEGMAVVPRLVNNEEEGMAGAVAVPVLVDRMRLAGDGLTSSLGLAGAQLRLISRDRTFPFTLPFMKRMTRRAEGEIAAAISEARAIGNLLVLYRAAGGFDATKTYLVILQNSMELRPTGGFIGSVATMTVEGGVMGTPVVADVYALDGQLKGHVDPPTPIRELLREEHWYLRDSNWDPDFRESGLRAAWFYEKETGMTVDGVIAVTTSLLTDLLGVSGPIDLPDYNDRITKENFFGKSLFYTKADFFPGSTQKKDFLGSLMVALLGRMTSGRPGDASGFMRVVGRALERGDIQFWFSQRQVQAIAQQAGWTGEVARPEPCEALTPPCAVERLGLVEANLGVNKVNPFIRRSVKTRIDVGQDGAVDGAVDVTYQNTSTNDAAIISGGGTYLTYLRAFLPADALILSTTLDGTPIPGKAAKLSELTTPYRDAEETIDGSMVAGVAFTVPPGGERTVTITYRRGIPLTFEAGEATVVLSVRKQPGMTDTTLDAAIGYPAGWHTQPAGSAGLLANASEVRYNTTLDQTKTFTVTFTK